MGGTEQIVAQKPREILEVEVVAQWGLTMTDCPALSKLDSSDRVEQGLVN